MATVDYIKENPNLIDESKALVLDQFQDSTIINKILEVGLSGIVDYEALLVEFALETRLQNAVGVQLDEIGQQLGVVRNKNGDEAYRTLIKIQAKRNTLDVTRESLIELVRLSTGDQTSSLYSGYFHLVEMYAADACIENVANPADVARLFPVNTNLRIITAESTLFGFEGTPNTLGFGSVDDLVTQGVFGSLTYVTNEDSV